MDRVNIKAKMLELEASRENAKEIACHYRDRCNELTYNTISGATRKTLQIYAQGLHHKQKVRQFWKNEILEGKSHSGRILKSALIKIKK